MSIKIGYYFRCCVPSQLTLSSICSNVACSALERASSSKLRDEPSAAAHEHQQQLSRRTRACTDLRTFGHKQQLTFVTAQLYNCSWVLLKKNSSFTTTTQCDWKTESENMFWLEKQVGGALNELFCDHSFKNLDLKIDIQKR